MLEIVDLKKDYPMQDQVVHALNGLNLCFRRNEFVSVLGPSGCGKTTLLNIVGGLDRYTSGDLIIDGVSTKEFKDKDWDNYRNHRVGFVFQSYNLIPHQTVLENVELALTLSGIKRDERKRRAIEVLNKVGLGDKLKSKPNQLSGGQMQRVSIARALVNDPEIILADEPTGALDSKTSVQIMDLLKEISKDRLVIMVTHNPDLANTYSSRIIKLLDGELVEDSLPYSSKEANKEIERFKAKQEKEAQKLDKNGKPKQKKKKSMSFFTSLFLSFRNLLTKKGRTILVSFAGSIGIIGIALILAISTGFSNYTNKIQEDTLSTYPITIQAKSVDFSSVINSLFLNKEESDSINHDKDGIYPKDTISNIFGTIGDSLNSNNLKKFYNHLNDHYSEVDEHINAVKYTYDINLEFYMNDPAKTPVQPNSNALIKMLVTYSLAYFENETHAEIDTSEIGYYTIRRTDDIDYTFIDKYDALQSMKQKLIDEGSVRLSTAEVVQLSFTLIGMDASSTSGTSTMSMFGSTNMVYEMIDNEHLVREQYDILGTNGRFPSASNEAVLVLDKNNEIDEYVLYSLGLMSDDNMNKLLTELVKGNKFIPKVDYDDIIGREYKTLDDSDYYIKLKDQSIIDYRTYKDPGTQEEPNDLYNMAEYYKQHEIALNNTENKIKIVGVLRLKDNVEKGSLPTGLAYTNKFTHQMIEHYNNSVGVSSNKLSEIYLDNPATISIYVKSFESKQAVQEFINRYNESAENGDEITYVDYVGLIMSAVSTIITSITYVLIAFVSVSLIVSSIMIGIITYISVIERTKEIGVLRSVGASKRDVKHVFTAESFIIGLTSGVFGIIVSLLLTIPINIVFKSFTGIAGLASLSPIAAVVLIAISVVLTFISGLIPSSVAGKKDPVIALRSE